MGTPDVDKEKAAPLPFAKIAMRKWLLQCKRLISRKAWKEDARRGINRLQTTGTSVVERSFEEIELVRLRYHLENADQELFDAYQILGKKCVEHWTKGRHLIEVERKRECRKILQVDEEKAKILHQIRDLKESPLEEESNRNHPEHQEDG